MAGGSSEVAASLTTDDDFPSSSVHKVLSNDDLLMEILLRLPVLSLHLFKPVSKQWLSLITSQTFTLTRTQSPTFDPPSGLFIEQHCGWDPVVYDFVSFDPRIPSERLILLTFNSEVPIVQSCNGLLLCYMPNDKYFVCNPLINMFEMLPPIHDLNYELNGVDHMYMAFDPTKSPFYKVVHVGGVEEVDDDDDDDDEFYYRIRIQTYSSETGVWSVWDDLFSDSDFESFGSGIYWNGAIHWLNYGEPYPVKLDIVDCPVLKHTNPPSFDNRRHMHSDRKLFNSHGSLLLLCKDYVRSHLDIYEMQIGNAEWLFKYFVNLDDMMRPFPTLRMPAHWECRDILSITLGEREEDLFIVVALSGKVLQYKFLLETVSELFDLGKEVRRRDCFEFIASFAHV